MTEIQRQATAAGFLHALRTSSALYDEWMATAKNDVAAVGKLIQRTVGLAQTPAKDDLEAMAIYIDGHLKEDAARFHAEHPGAPHHVGSVFLMQQG